MIIIITRACLLFSLAAHMALLTGTTFERTESLIAKEAVGEEK